jgi:hypothetical protein
MPVIVTALVALGLQAAALVARRVRAKPATDSSVPATPARPPVGARRSRQASRRKAA